MNTCIFMGRLTKDPEVRYGQSGKAMATYSVAVERTFKKDGQPDADFANFKSFGGQAEFVEKYIHKGTKVLIRAHFMNDNFTGRDGQTVYRDVFVTDSVEFAESKAASQNANANASKPTGNTRNSSPAKSSSDDFMAIPDGIDEQLPFN